MNRARLIFVAVFISSMIFAGSAAGQAYGVESSVEGTIYSYGDEDIPEVFFFPKEKSRWDGSKVTMREWYMLTDLQKERFISEYFSELKKQYEGAVGSIGLDGYIKALNLFSYYSNDKSLNEPSTKFIDTLMKAQGK